MTAETETKPTAEQIDDKKEITKEEEAEKAAEKPKSDDSKCEKKESEKKEEKPKKEAPTPKPSVHKVDYEKDIVYLYQFTRTPVLPSLSPYCLKVETWLRLAGLKYENIDHRMKYKSKKGQLPFVEVNGEEIADSAIILKELGLQFNQDLDTGLSSEQKNIVHANVSMIENHFAWVTKSFFYRNPDLMIQSFGIDVKKMIQKPLPGPILTFIFKRKISAAAKKVRAHGIGVHKPEEIEEFGRNDLKVLSDLLGDKQFFFGETPSTLDVVAFANLAQVVFMSKDVSYGLRDWMNEECPNLNAFCERMKERAFPDWDEMCTNLDLNSHLPKPPPPPPEEEKKEEEKKEEEVAAETKDAEKEKEKEKEQNGEKKEEKKEDEKKEKVEEKEKEKEKPDEEKK